MSGKKKYDISKKLLEDLLYVQHKSIAKIASELGVDKRTISSRMSDYGLPTRTEYNKQHITKELLEVEYVQKQQSIKDLSKKLGCGRDWLREQLVEYGMLTPTSPRPKPKIDLTYEYFQREYFENGKSLLQLAKESGQGRRKVKKAFRAFGLKTKKQLSCGDDVHYHQSHFHYAVPDEMKDEIAQLVEEGWLVSDLAIHYGCSQDVMYATLTRMGIQWNKTIEITQDELFQLYVEEGQSMLVIAEHFGCSAGTVLNRLKEYGIERRKSSEWNELGLLVEDVRLLLQNGYSYQAIGKELGCSFNAIRNFAEAHDLVQYRTGFVTSFESDVMRALKDVGFDSSSHDRKIISPQEIDLVVEEVGIGIEVCPCFTHSSDAAAMSTMEPKPCDYHRLKAHRAWEAGLSLATQFDWTPVEDVVRQVQDLQSYDRYSVGEVSSLDAARIRLADPLPDLSGYRLLLAGRWDGTESFEHLLPYRGEERYLFYDDSDNGAEYAIAYSISTGGLEIHRMLAVGECDPNTVSSLFSHLAAVGGCKRVVTVSCDERVERELLKRIGFEEKQGLPEDYRWVHKKGRKWYGKTAAKVVFQELEALSDEDAVQYMQEHYYYKVYNCGWTEWYWEID